MSPSRTPPGLGKGEPPACLSLSHFPLPNHFRGGISGVDPPHVPIPGGPDAHRWHVVAKRRGRGRAANIFLRDRDDFAPMCPHSLLVLKKKIISQLFTNF